MRGVTLFKLSIIYFFHDKYIFKGIIELNPSPTLREFTAKSKYVNFFLEIHWAYLQFAPTDQNEV